MTQGAKPVLAVDVDEVLYPFMELFVDYHNQNHGTNGVVSDFPDYHIQENLGITKEQKVERLGYFLEQGGFTSGVPVEHSQDALKMLSERFEIVVVTSRWQEWEESTVKWLSEHYPNIFGRIEYANSIAWHRGDKYDKDAICKELGAVAFIDDALDNVEKVAATGIKSLLFGDYPWNQSDKLPDNVQRVKDWDEVLEVLL